LRAACRGFAGVAALREPRAVERLERCSLLFGKMMMQWTSMSWCGDRMSAVEGTADLGHLGSDVAK